VSDHPINREQAERIDKGEALEAQFRDSESHDQLAAALCDMIDALVESVVKTGKGGKPLGKLLMEQWESKQVTYEDIVAIRFQILDAKDSALRPT